MGNELSFTTARLRSIVAPKKGRVYYRDTKQPGLQLCVTATGSKTFYFVRRIDSRPTRMQIGRHGDISLDQARRAARELVGQVASGHNPAAERRTRRQVATVGEAFTYYIDQHAQPHKRTWKADQQQYDRYVKKRWHSRSLDTIRRRDVQALHTKIGAEHGHYAANRLRSLLHSMFAVAIDGGLWQGPNPVAGIKKFKEKQRERFLNADELGRFFRSLAVETSEVVRDYLLLLLLTAARRSNLLSMQWRDVDFEQAVWTIPDTKTGDSLMVPLTPESLGVLARRREAAGDSVWVFPSSKSNSGHLQCPEKIWTRVLARAELTDVRLHDLRRTAASWQALSGSSLQVIGKSLGHKQVATTEIYARLTLDPVRKSVERATTAMYEAGKVRLLENKEGDQ